MKHTLVVLVENKPGVLTHVSGLISRRNFNIESINAGYTEEADMSRITIEVDADDEYELEQVVNQLSKLIDVIKIIDLTGKDRVHRDLALIKVKASPENRAEIVNLAEIFRAHIVDVNKETMIIELTGEDVKIDAICELLDDYGIIEIVRTGKIAICRGPKAAKDV
ncbi:MULTISPECIES: acetolactate synthase small subunit [Dehalobacter]|jgi:acetolactate synthase-1/3 small subunit|uniref:Acetolactate synthase small subunit n=2 Tax=Dehalobacter restrictus TaxID=55583 RepID=A0A857DHD6_9FIRM|nr:MULTISPECIES: acetolactate synthase small subunit [Dehalobacter]AHF10148.1 acetolactate synthase [Dehalobacter restrictus DSM 9455]MCG1025037.1 acetolactate synthase small subunit [Dehalobacter sp.]MDJ0305729.1 acetolactate synthase small subunit [Dehalobacter sp.]OCZ52601.1 acetolactate synthase small subunit [Dehalobacter sp. TeCB1]QHA00750.1 acetolactate synthase small subunit [Dehalobacter restrictus]